MIHFNLNEFMLLVSCDACERHLPILVTDENSRCFCLNKDDQKALSCFLNDHKHEEQQNSVSPG